ncbi:hypothetical protein [Magnetovibrio sp.]
MNTFMAIWAMWAHLFSPLPYGDPYIASFGAVTLSIMFAKTLKSALRHM